MSQGFDNRDLYLVFGGETVTHESNLFTRRGGLRAIKRALLEFIETPRSV